MTAPSTELAMLTGARNALEQARTLDEVKAILDVALAAKRYAEAQKLGHEAMNYAQEIINRATRRLGEILVETPKVQPKPYAPREDGSSIREKVGYKISARSQQLAKLPEDVFEASVSKPQNHLLRTARIAEKEKEVARIAEQPPAPLASLGPFPVLYVDPPWRYEYAVSDSRKIENNYPTMTLDEIKALSVPASDDAVLFLWATSPKLTEGLDVMAAWGFEYRTCMVWVKDRIGMGYYARQQHELLLIGKRGLLPVPDPEDRPSSVIAAAQSAHSAKPDEAYAVIERMYPLRERCELFQRRPRHGWAGWGNQAGTTP